ncbi:MAG TPA: tetratricopeptide repeat protein [Bacteroidetes bacterium]|nr:tetratricopeptide repeat protein [Bacteroidota bacterium]
MRNLSILSLLVIFSLSFFSCSDYKSGLISHINEIEEKLNSTTYTPKLNKENIYLIRELYQDFIEHYPEDTLTATYAFSLAQNYVHAKKYTLAIEQLDYIINKHSTAKTRGKAMFYKGFLYWENLNMPEKAKLFFQDFIDQYPEHPLKNDAISSIKIIENKWGLEDIIKQNKAS